jgi:hypothetical protein
MTDGLSASRLSLEGDRRKAVEEIARTDQETADLDARRQMLVSRRDFLQAKVDQLTEGIAALRTVERGGQDPTTTDPSTPTP